MSGLLAASIVVICVMLAVLVVWRSGRKSTSVQGIVAIASRSRSAPTEYDVLDGSPLKDPVEIPIIGPTGTYFVFVNQRNAVRYHRYRSRGFMGLRRRPAGDDRRYRMRRSLRADSETISGNEWVGLWWGTQIYYAPAVFDNLIMDATLDRSLATIASHLLAEHPEWNTSDPTAAEGIPVTESEHAPDQLEDETLRSSRNDGDDWRLVSTVQAMEDVSTQDVAGESPDFVDSSGSDDFGGGGGSFE